MRIIDDNLPLFTLIKMQLKNKTAASFKANKLSFIIKILLYAVLLSGITTALYFLFKLFADRSIFGLFVLPIYFYNFVFIFAFIVILLNCLNRFTDDLYLSPDNQFLVTLPVSSNKVFLSKLIVYYLLELLRSAMILMPLFISYGALNNFRVGYYFWLFFIMLLVLWVPVCFASIFSILVLKAKIWFKNNPIKQNIIIFILLAGIFVAFIALFALIPQELRIDEKWQTVILPRLKNGALTIEKIFYPITMISMLLLGYTDSSQSPYRLHTMSKNTWWLLLVLLVFIALCLLLDFYFVKKLFIKNVAKSYEHNKYVKNISIKIREDKFLNKVIYVYNKKDKKPIQGEDLITLLDKIYINNPNLFTKETLQINDYENILKKNFKSYIFEVKNIENDPSKFKQCIGIYNSKKSSHLNIIIEKKNNKYICYDSYIFSKRSVKHTPVFTMIKKDFIRDFRSASSLASNLAVIFAPAILVFALNKIFSGLRLTLLGGQLVFAFIILIELIALFTYSMGASSIYSKDQKNAYILNVSPVNYAVSITSKLVHQFIIGIISISLLVFNYAISTPLNFINFMSLFLMFVFILAFHLIVSAEIDLRNLDKFNFSSKTSEKAGEQNEMYAALFSIAFAVIFSVISFFLVKEKSSGIATRLMFIALALLLLASSIFIARLLVKGKKIKEAK